MKCTTCKELIDEARPDSWRLRYEEDLPFHVECVPCDEDAMHVYPTYEEHDLTEACWCRPTVQYRDPRTGETFSDPLVIHRDAEQRAAEAS